MQVSIRNEQRKDDAVYDAIADLMSEGRTSRLYRALVRDKKIASVSAGFTGFPGNKYPHLFAFFAFPLPGHTPREIEDAIFAVDDLERTVQRALLAPELALPLVRQTLLNVLNACFSKMHPVSPSSALVNAG